MTYYFLIQRYSALSSSTGKSYLIFIIVSYLGNTTSEVPQTQTHYGQQIFIIFLKILKMKILNKSDFYLLLVRCISNVISFSSTKDESTKLCSSENTTRFSTSWTQKASSVQEWSDMKCRIWRQLLKTFQCCISINSLYI